MRILVLITIFLAACGSGSGSSQPAAIKNLFTTWTSFGCNNWGFINLAQGTFSTNFTATYNIAPPCQCSCTANFVSFGTSPNPNGTYTISSCAFVASSCAPAYGGCSTWNDSGSWYITNNQLTLASGTLPNSQKVCLQFQ